MTSSPPLGPLLQVVVVLADFADIVSIFFDLCDNFLPFRIALRDVLLLLSSGALATVLFEGNKALQIKYINLHVDVVVSTSAKIFSSNDSNAIIVQSTI